MIAWGKGGVDFDPFPASSGFNVGSGASGLARRALRRRKNQTRVAMMPSPATPPTTPPAIAPTGVEDDGFVSGVFSAEPSPGFVSGGVFSPESSPGSFSPASGINKASTSEDHSILSKPLIRYSLALKNSVCAFVNHLGAKKTYPSSYQALILSWVRYSWSGS